MNRNIAPFGLRMPEELKALLQEQAKKNKRSLNAEILAILEEYVKVNYPNHHYL